MDGQSGRGCPWTHCQISHDTSADGSISGISMATCFSGGHDKESVWGIWLYVLSDVQPLLTSSDNADKYTLYNSPDHRAMKLHPTE